MLEKLDNIPWSHFIHAYGPAFDVPLQLRDLLHRDRTIRQNALEQLWSNIVHQGTPYQPAPFAIPFLFELALSPHTPSRHQILYLILGVALGFEERFLPHGVNATRLRADLERQVREMSPSQQAACKDFGYGPRISLDCYTITAAHIPSLYPLLECSDSDVRMAAIYSLAWFPEHAQASLSVLEACLETILEERHLVTALLSMGLLIRSARMPLSPNLYPQYQSHSSLPTRLAANIAFSQPPYTKQVIATLTEALRSADDLADVGTPFNEGDLVGYASLLLAHVDRESCQTAVAAMTAALAQASAVRSLDITTTLLQLLKNQRGLLTSTAYSHLERLVLRAIHDHGAWTMDHCRFLDYSDLLRSFGLPATQQDLAKWMEHRTQSLE